MASRVNLKFVTILAVSAVVLLGLVGGVWYALTVKSGEDYEILGDTKMAEGDYQAAERFYSIAVNHDQTNVAWLDKWLSAVEAWTPETETAYRDAFSGKYVPIIARIASERRTDVAAHERFLGLIHRQMVVFPYSRRSAEGVIESVNDALPFYESAASPDPRWPTLRKYRGLAYERILSVGGVVDEPQRETARADLEAALAADPSDALAAAGLIRWDVHLAGQEAARGRLVDASDLLARAAQTGRTFLENNPGEPRVALHVASVEHEIARLERTSDLFGDALVQAAQDLRDEYGPRLDTVLEQMQSVDPMTLDLTLVSRFQQIERSIDPAGRSARSAQLVDHLLASRGDDASLLTLGSRLFEQRGEYERARELLVRITEEPDRPVSFDGLLLLGQRTDAHGQLADVLLQEYFRVSSDDERADEAAELLAQSKSWRDAFAARVPEDNVRLLFINGLTALAEDDPGAALRHLERYNEQTLNNDPRGVWRQGQAATGLRQFGRAEAAFRRLIELQPGNLLGRLALAETQVRLSKLDDAERTLRQVLAVAPDNELAQRQLALLEQVRNPDAATDPVQGVLIRARQLQMGDTTTAPDIAGAVALLEQGMADLDNDPRIARQLAAFRMDAGDREGAREAISAALESHPESEGLADLAAALAGESDIESVEQVIAASYSDPLERELALYTAMVNSGERERAFAALDRAIAIDAEDPRVLDFAFRRAITVDDFAEAERLTGIAEATDADRAAGVTFRARLLIAQGDTGESRRILEQAAEGGAVDPTLLRILGVLHAAEGRMDLAISTLERALAITPNDVEAQMAYLRSLASSGRTTEALNAAREAQRYLSGRNDFRNLWLRLESQAGGEEGLRMALDRRRATAVTNPGNRANKVELARLLISAREWDDARTLLDELRSEQDDLQLVSLAAAWYADQGRVLDKQGESVDGIAAATREFVQYLVPLSDRAELTSGYLAMAQFMVPRGRYDIAFEAVREAQNTQDPATRRADKAMGDLYLGLRRPEQAHESFEAVVAAGADDEQGSYTRKLIETSLRTERFERADELMQGLDEEQRSTLVAMLQRAEIATGLDRLNDASRILDEAVAAYPTRPLVYVKRAESRLGRPELADDVLADLQEALRLDPDNWQALRVRGTVYFAQNREDQAIADLRDSLRSNIAQDQLLIGLMVELLQRDRGGEALDLAVEILDQRESDVRLMVACANTFLPGEDWDRAGVLFERAWNRGRDFNVGLRYLESLLLGDRPQIGQATRLLEEMEALGADIASDPLLIAGRAMVDFARGRAAGAERSLREGLELAGETPGRLVRWSGGVSRAFAVAGDDSGEIELLRTLRDENEGAISRWLTYFLAERLRVIEDGSGLAEARDLLASLPADESAELTEPLNLLAYRAAGLAALQQERPDEAVATWKAGLERFPEDWELNNNLAYVLTRELGDAEAALDHALLAVAGAPNRTEVHDTLGVVYLQLDRPDEAEPVLQTALRLATTGRARASAAVHLADAELRRGNRAVAASLLNEAVVLTRTVTDLDETVLSEIERLGEEIGSGG
ncbi:MAG: tetratricopeptide repeat protein [Planctomycetota bacterium]